MALLTLSSPFLDCLAHVLGPRRVTFQYDITAPKSKRLNFKDLEIKFGDLRSRWMAGFSPLSHCRLTDCDIRKH